VKSHCINGHAMTPDNVVRRTYRGGQCHRCRACAREAARRKAEANRRARSASPHGTKVGGYIPLDELLAMPFNRVLRGLRRFDWVETHELLSAIEAPEVDCTERNTLTCAISRMVSRGEIERRDSPRTFVGARYEVRITAMGLARLERTFADYHRRLESEPIYVADSLEAA
jgi:hypothetical protein